MAYLEKLLPEFRKGAKIRHSDWDDGEYMYIKNGKVYDEKDKTILISLGRCADIFCSDGWELYQELINWEYIIKNKCLCWFWDCNPDFVIHLGHLTRLMPNCPHNEEFNYCKDNGAAFKNCRPVRRDEVTFYEDREK